MIKSIIYEIISEKLFKFSTIKKRCLGFCGIKIYFINPEFYHFYCESINKLERADPINHLRILTNIKSIVEINRSAKWAGHATNTFYDETDMATRKNAGILRYGARLVRFAVEVKTLKALNSRTLPTIDKIQRRRILEMAVERELACCERLNCEARHIYALQRWLRANNY